MSDRRYGYFRCPKCNAHWESSHVYCDGSTAVFEQECMSCRIGCLPHRVEPIICSVCKRSKCTCTSDDRKERNVNPKKPHRRDLCQKCKSGKPCH